jgi:hypothetical protein
MSGMSKQDADIIGKALQQPATAAKRLPALPARGGIPSATATGTATQTTSTATGGGIDSPLTEQSGSYWPTVQAVTSDGLLQIAYQPIKSVTMKDKSGREVVFNYVQPTAS